MLLLTTFHRGYLSTQYGNCCFTMLLMLAKYERNGHMVAKSDGCPVSPADDSRDACSRILQVMGLVDMEMLVVGV